jgi:hypothetical protein
MREESKQQRPATRKSLIRQFSTQVYTTPTTEKSEKNLWNLYVHRQVILCPLRKSKFNWCSSANVDNLLDLRFSRR